MDSKSSDTPDTTNAHLPDILAARLVIADAAGIPRIVLGLDERGEPAIQLFDCNGDERALLALGSAPDQEAISIAQLRLAASDDLASIDLIASEDGRAVIEVGNDPDEIASLLLEVEREEGDRQASIILGNRKASIKIAVRDGQACFGTQGGR